MRVRAGAKARASVRARVMFSFRVRAGAECRASFSFRL